MSEHEENIKKEVIAFFKNPKFINTILVILFLILLVVSVNIRTSNSHLLIDSTSGKTIPLALDPYYFLRVAETMVEQGGLPEYDVLRSPGTNVQWLGEILPSTVVGMYKIAHLLNSNITIADVHVLSPVIFFAIGLIIFFFMCYALTKSKWASLIASGLLAFSPAFIYRTTMGFADHDAQGIVAVFACLLIYTLALNKNRFEKSWIKTILWGLLLGFFTTLTLVSWGGAITFLLLVIPSAFFIYYLLNSKKQLNAITFYAIWILSSTLFSLLFGYPLNSIPVRLLGSYGLLAPFILVFMLIDQIISKVKLNSKYFKARYQELYSLAITSILGIIGLIAMGRNPLLMIQEIWFKLMRPFVSASSRLELTVAENAQPYLLDWIGQVGTGIFWLFFVGIILVGIDFSLKIKRRRYQAGFVATWILFVSSILFSRISSQSTFNGINFMSQAFYFMGLVIFGGYFIYLMTKSKFGVKSRDILFLTLIIFTLIYGRSASRIFFLITPFMFLIVGNLIVRSFGYARRVNDDVLKIIFWGIFAIALIISLSSINNYYTSVNNSVKNMGPSANIQWQQSMSWVRENTQQGDVFVHWWDYGYWVEYLGERPAVTDGGHSGGSAADHYIGRYVLTTPSPKSALSYMKTWNVSYLLIDQTDLGKYSAYSKIGSDLDWDRFSVIPVMVVDAKQTHESANGSTLVYSGTVGVDKDTIYEEGENLTSIFLPGPSYDNLGTPSYKSYVLGTILELGVSASGTMFKQPKTVYYYNGNQITLPSRYLYVDGQLIDFETGVESLIMIIPSFNGNSLNNLGAIIYLSPKVQKSLFARLYLLDDVFEEYPTLKMAHSEDDPVTKALRKGGLDLNEFVYYKGLRGPIKIWEVDYPEGTETHSEFIKKNPSSFGDMDYLFY